MAKIVQNAPVNTVSIAGITANLDDSRFILLFVSCGPSNYDSFETSGGAKYQVPAGKSLRVLAGRFCGENTAVGLSMGYGSTSVGNSASAPTGSVGLHRNATLAILPGQTAQTVEMALGFYVPQNMYGYVKANAGGNQFACLLCQLV